MDVLSLRSPIVRRCIRAINDSQLDDFLSLFIHNATVVDSTTYHGLVAIEHWAQRETFGVHMYIDVLEEKDDKGLVLEIEARSQGGYSGPGTFSFELRGDFIERLVIS